MVDLATAEPYLLLLLGAGVGSVATWAQTRRAARSSHRDRQRDLLVDLQARIDEHLAERLEYVREVSDQLNRSSATGRDPAVIVHMMTLASDDLRNLNRATDGLLLDVGRVANQETRDRLRSVLEDSRTPYSEASAGEEERSLSTYFDWLEAWGGRLQAGRKTLSGGVAEEIRRLDRPGWR